MTTTDERSVLSGDADTFDDFFSTTDAADPSAAVGAPPEPPKVPPRLGLLAALSVEEFDVVARSAQLKFHVPETVIFRQGDDADRFFILVDGKVRIERDGELVAQLGNGEFFGESAILVGGKRSATVVTETDSSLWSIDYAAFTDAVSTHLLSNDDVARQIQERIDATPPESFR